MDDVYAHVQRLPPQTRTYYNEQQYTNAHTCIHLWHAFGVGIRAQWTSIPTNINTHTLMRMKTTCFFFFRFDIRCLDVGFMFSFLLIHSVCVCVLFIIPPRQMYWCEWIHACCFYALFSSAFACTPVSLQLLLLLLVVMVGLKANEKASNKKHSHIYVSCRVVCTWSCERRHKIEKGKKSTTIYIAYIKKKTLI